MDDKRPLILFDGVCNLCNAAVAWVVERDTGASFRFASLQSEAARQALEDAGGLAPIPDSIVLIDAAGIHTASSAALRIGSWLGFPWSLGAIFSLVPRPLRDGVYALIARNRYRWFGRRDACMVPTPEIAGRFLDAGEPPREPPPAAAPATAGAGLLSTFVLRLVLTYLFISIFPFPVGTLPATGGLETLYDKLGKALIPWVGRTLFHTPITIFPGGSGDTTYNYVELFVNASLAVLGAAAWTLARRGRAVSPRTWSAMAVYVRFYLAVTLLSYGWDKVFPLQFIAPGPDRLIMTYGDSSPMGLLWTFMGASQAYMFFCGLGEVAGGTLLLFRRTAAFGAILSAALLLNVVMLNFCFDVPVKLFSLHLLGMALFLIAPQFARLSGMLFFNLPTAPDARPQTARPPWRRRAALALGTSAVILAMFLPVNENYQMLTSSPGPLLALHGLYRVESFTRDGVADRALPDPDRWVRVGINSIGYIAIQRADGSTRRFLLDLDAAGKTLSLAQRGAPEPFVLTYRQERGVLLVKGRFEDGDIIARIVRQDKVSSLLTDRGFHWINEYPFNR